jgi:hypothetical protein
MINTPNRRAFLLGSTAIAGGVMTLTAVARSAAALTIQEAGPESAVGRMLADRCKADDAHAAIRAALEAKLVAETGTPGSTLWASETCPLCGCPVIASRKVE